MTKSNSSATLSTSNLYEHPWFSQLNLLDGITTSESRSQQKPRSETTGAKCTKQCTKCLQTKPVDQFGKHRQKPDGLYPHCKACVKTSTTTINTLRKENPIGNQTECMCCGETKPLVLDHCYETNTFRGYICSDCNTAIGKLGDNYEGVKQALIYLERTNGHQIQNYTGSD